MIKFLNFDIIDSTNEYIKRNADKLDSGTVVTAKIQTAGKGRLGRKFISNVGGIYMSVIVKDVKEEVFDYITPMTALAVCKAIEPFAENVSVKWVNDVLVDGKKVCGILCESLFENNKPKYVIVGIGINAILPENGFDVEIKDIATALMKNSDEKAFSEIMINTVIYLADMYENFDPKSIVSEYIKRSSLVGKEIGVVDGNRTFEGKVVGFNEKCNLILETNEGIKIISSGSIVKS